MERHAKIVAREIDEGGFHVLFAHQCRWFAAPHVPRFSRTPSVLYLQEPLRHLHESKPYPIWTAPSNRPWIERFGRLWVLPRQRRLAAIEWMNAQAPATILVNSLFSRESIVRAYGRNARFCPLGVDSDYWTPGVAPRERIVAGVGTILPHKGIDVALRCLARLPGPRPRMEWIGNFTVGSYAKEMESLASKLGVSLTLRLAATQDEVRDLMRRASLFFFPARLEPLGYAPLEAAACGCPVVGFREGGVRETVRHGETGWLGQDEEELVEAIGRFFSEPGVGERMGAAGREWVVRNWGFDTLGRELENELAKVAKERRG